MIETNIVTALICILGCLAAIFIAIFQIRLELRKIWKEGIHETRGMVISEEDVKKIARLVLDEMNKNRP